MIAGIIRDRSFIIKTASNDRNDRSFIIDMKTAIGDRSSFTTASTARDARSSFTTASNARNARSLLSWMRCDHGSLFYPSYRSSDQGADHASSPNRVQ